MNRYDSEEEGNANGFVCLSVCLLDKVVFGNHFQFLQERNHWIDTQCKLGFTCNNLPILAQVEKMNKTLPNVMPSL